MTSSGYRFPARALTGLAILVFTAASVLPAARVRAQSAFGSRQPSARIYALGREFAGIIPDQLTDLTLNPAMAWNAESFTINYGIRDPNSLAYPFPLSEVNLVPDFDAVKNYNTNEIRLFGFKGWGLRWAVDAEWKLEHVDECSQPENKVLERYTDGKFGYRTNDVCTISDNNYARLEIASAARISDRTVLGIRAGGTFWYYNDKNRRRYMRDIFQYSEYTGGYVQYTGHSEDNYDDKSYKLFTGFLEAGMTWSDSGELVVKGGYSEGTYLNNNYDLRIDSGYDRYTGDLDSYRYQLYEFGESREGDTWLLSVLAKKRFSGGLVLLAAGSYESGSYECYWQNSNEQYSWGDYVDLQLQDYILYPADGTRSRSGAAFRIGKTYSLEKKIDLTPGLHIGYTKEKFEETGDVSVDSDLEIDGPSAPIHYSFPAGFDRALSRTDLIVPLAIEFRAASFFHLYSGFNVNFTWIRDGKNNTFLPYYVQPEQTVYPNGTEEDGTRFSSSYSASLGFSLRYREKLFFDMFTGTDIVPERLTYYHFDLRYVF